ncbi:MAG: MFS transporter, partial [Candidatus Heimdallarchaeota archaeon]|nr:MFS transporter [Candidatus Heimdallarchaeota archaeon]
PIGLFMQDLVLEPFAIENLHFEKTDVGKIVAIWTSLTLVFVPIGIKLIPKFGRLRIIVIGTILSSVGLIILTINSIILDIELFYIGLIIFGIGNGLNSGTGIGVMLDICASYPKNMSVLLGYFGVLITFGRFVASIIGGLILNIFELRPLSNYFYLFGIESFITIITIIPMIILHRNINVSYSPASSPINPIDVISMSDL